MVEDRWRRPRRGDGDDGLRLLVRPRIASVELRLQFSPSAEARIQARALRVLKTGGNGILRGVRIGFVATENEHVHVRVRRDVRTDLRRCRARSQNDRNECESECDARDARDARETRNAARAKSVYTGHDEKRIGLAGTGKAALVARRRAKTRRKDRSNPGRPLQRRQKKYGRRTSEERPGTCPAG